LFAIHFFCEKSENRISQLFSVPFGDDNPVEVQERERGSSSGPFVAIKERVPNRDRNNICGSHVEEIEEKLTAVRHQGSGGGGFKSLAIPEAWITTRLLYFTPMNVENVLYVQEQRLVQLLSQFVEGLPMAGRHGVVGRFAVHPANEQPVLSRNDFYHLVTLNLEEL
jgi:hypothetical protein